MNLGKVLKKYQMGGQMFPDQPKAKSLPHGYKTNAEAVKALTDYAYKDRTGSDTWIDVPQKLLMWATGSGYQKPSDLLMKRGITKEGSALNLAADLVIDPLNVIGAKPAITAFTNTAAKAGYYGKEALKYLNNMDAGKEAYNYGKNKASEVNNWLGENIGYKFPNGGIMKNYSFGGDISRFALNNLEQATLGTLGMDFYKPKFDSDTFQQVNDVTQKINGGLQDVGAGIANTVIPGISGVRQVGKQMSQFPKGGLMKNYANGGRIYKEVILDGKKVNKWVGEDGKLYDNENDVVLPKPQEFNGDKPTQKIEQSQESSTYKYNNIEYKKIDDQWMWKSNKTGAYHPAKNFNDDFIERNNLEPNLNKNYKKNLVSQKSIKNTNSYHNVDEDYETDKISWYQGNTINYQQDNSIEEEQNKNERNGWNGRTLEQDMEKWKYKGGIMKNYQQGGIMPQNPNDLQAITENTMEFNGNSHKSGGIPLINGKELEKDETVIKEGAIGNADPYAISPNLVLDRETAKLVGLSSKYAGMKLSDISRKIEDMKAAKPNDVMSEKTNAMNKKFALNRLIKANEILSAKHRQENPVNEISDLRQEEMPQMQLGGNMNENKYRSWMNKIGHTQKAGYNVDENYSGIDYDYRGFYKEFGDVYLENGQHLVDKYKLPNHETFSVESQYYKEGMPSGKWDGDNYIPINREYEKLKNGMIEGFKKGSLVKNYQLGGNLTEQSMLLNSMDGTAPVYKYPNLNMNDLSYSPYTDASKYSTYGVYKPTTNVDTPKVDEKTGFNLKDNLGNIGIGLKGASLLANFATIGKKPGQIPAQFNPYTNDILNNYRNTIDNQSIKNDVTSVLNTGLNSNPSRNWNVQRATNAELTGNAMEAMSKANLQNQEANNRYRSELGNVENNLGVQNVQAKNMAEVLNAQTQANWRNNLRSAIGNVGNDVADMTLKKDYLNKYTDEHIKILNEKGKDYGISFANTEEYLKAITNPETSLILGKIQKGTATPEEIQRYKDIQAGKPVDYTKK
jgi:hypothetical protein